MGETMQTDTPFGARVQHEPGRVLCVLSGRLTCNSYGTFRPLLEAADTQGASEMVLDLGELRFLDSNGLSMLLVLRERVSAAGRRMRLVNVPPRVDKVLARTGTQAMLGAA